MKNKLRIPDITPTPISIQHEICEQTRTEIDDVAGGGYYIACYQRTNQLPLMGNHRHPTDITLRNVQ